jgi:hypothetical protein
MASKERAELRMKIEVIVLNPQCRLDIEVPLRLRFSFCNSIRDGR